MKRNKNTSKVLWVDVSKGIVITLMVIGHSSIPNWLSHWIWTFHMPFFFVISALFITWNKDNWHSFVKRKSKILLIPFLIYSLINILIIPFSIGVPHITFIKKVVLHGWGGIALWFVPVFFLANIFCKIISKNEYLYSIIFLIIGVALSYSKLVLPWALSSVPFAIFLMLIVKKNQKIIKNFISSLKVVSLFALMILGLLISYIISCFWHLDMAWNKIVPIIPLLVGIICGIMTSFSLSIFICNNNNIISKIFSHIGRNTYEIMAISQVSIMTINHFLDINSIFKYVILIVVLIGTVYLRKLIEGKYSKIEAI